MITQVIISCLQDKTISISKKREFLENCSLSFSDYFNLMEEFKYDPSIVSMLKSLVYDGDIKLENSIKKYFKETEKKKILRRMKKVRRLESYD